MKKLVIGVFIVLALFSFFIFIRKGTNRAADFEITKKAIVTSSTNRAIVEGVVTNKGKNAQIVIVKARFEDESGAVLDEPFVSLNNFKAGEERKFRIESQIDYYKVTSFEVFIDAAQ